MKSYAVISVKTSKVVNLVVWDGAEPWNPGDEHITIETNDAGIGDMWDGSNFINPTQLEVVIADQAQTILPE